MPHGRGPSAPSHPDGAARTRGHQNPGAECCEEAIGGEGRKSRGGQIPPHRSRVGRRGKAGQLLSDRKSTRLNSSHQIISYAVFCLKKKKIDYVFINLLICVRNVRL